MVRAARCARARFLHTYASPNTFSRQGWNEQWLDIVNQRAEVESIMGDRINLAAQKVSKRRSSAKRRWLCTSNGSFLRIYENKM